MAARRFAHSFHFIGKPSKGATHHALKDHYSGLLREALGYLELLARRNPERFVFAYESDIAAHCHAYKQPRSISTRMLRYILHEFRERSIISKRIQRYWNGMMREGFYVAPWDALVVVEDGQAKFVGFDAKRRADWWIFKWQFFKHTSEPSSAISSAVSSAVCSAPSSAACSAPSSAPLPGQEERAEEVNDENQRLAFVALEPELAVEVVRAEPSSKTARRGAATPSKESLLQTKWKQKVDEYIENEDLYSALRFSKPFDSDIPKLLELVERDDIDFFEQCNNWAQMRQPPLDGIDLKNRWVVCLEECWGMKKK